MVTIIFQTPELGTIAIIKTTFPPTYIGQTVDIKTTITTWKAFIVLEIQPHYNYNVVDSDSCASISVTVVPK